MKKLLFSLLLIAAPVTGFAQLTVKSDGSVLAGTDDLGSFFIQLGSSSTKTTGYNIGVAGKSVITGYSGISCGVWGRAQNVNNGMTYGVAGDLHSYCTAGAGIVGSNMGILGYIISGKYAW